MAEKRKVAIIGLGPTGAFAARAAYDLNCEVDIYTVESKFTTPPGAFWLHWVPEDVTHQVSATQIYIQGKGTAKQYIKRQWGDLAPGVTSSFPEKPVWETGYNPELVLKHLVPAQCEEIRLPYALSDADIHDLSIKYDFVFQTFPTRESKQEQPALLPFVAAARFNAEDLNLSWVVYNGSNTGVVVREAVLFGHHFLEFPKNMTELEVRGAVDLAGWQVVTLKDLHPHTKPWSQDPKSKIKLVGRLAMWDRKFLSHDAYAYVQKVLRSSQ